VEAPVLWKIYFQSLFWANCSWQAEGKPLARHRERKIPSVFRGEAGFANDYISQAGDVITPA